MTTVSAAVATGRSGRRFEERVDPYTGEKYRAVIVRGEALTIDPLLNKVTSLTPDPNGTNNSAISCVSP